MNKGDRYAIEVRGPTPADDGRYVIEALVQGKCVAYESFDTLEGAMGCKRFMEDSLASL